MALSDDTLPEPSGRIVWVDDLRFEETLIRQFEVIDVLAEVEVSEVGPYYWILQVSETR